MSFQKSQTNIVLLLSFTILGLVYSQISVPLKINPSGSLYFTAPNSTYQCTTDIEIYTYGCTNLQLYKSPDTKLCLSNPTRNYSGFLFGNTLVNLTYTVFIEIQSEISYYFGVMCLGYNQKESESNKSVLSQLVSQNLISKQVIYFYFFQSMGQNDIIGEANLGSPNYNYIKKGANLVQLKKVHDNQEIYIVENRGLKFFGKQLESKDIIFTLDEYHYFTKKAFLQMVQIFEQQGIPHTFYRTEVIQFYEVSFPSVEMLQPIELSLTLEDNTSQNITLQVSQYTRQRENGQFYLTIQVLSNSNSRYMKIGRNVFQTYYGGFDQTNGTVQIAEIRDENRSLRRSQNNFD